MKKIVSLLFFLVFSISLLAQANLSNDTSHSLIISVDRKSFVLPPGGFVRTSLFPREGEVNYLITWDEGGRTKRERISSQVKNGDYIITNQHLLGQVGAAREEDQPSEIRVQTFDSNYQTALVIKNESSRNLLIKGGPLSGLALGPAQSSDSLIVPLGVMELTLLIDVDRADNSSGRNYRQEVVTGMITKDQTEFQIDDRHINIELDSEIVTFRFFNKTGFDIVGVGSVAMGRVIRANRRASISSEANQGFVNTAWQYFDENGIKRQAISEFVVTDRSGRTNVNIYPADLSRIYSVKK